MAGSLSYQVYESDAGGSFAIKCDLSNAIAVNPSASATPSGLPSYTVPRNVRPRYAIFRSADGFTTRRVPVLTAADLAALTSAKQFTTNPGGVVVKISTIVGEKTTLPKAVDTALTT